MDLFSSWGCCAKDDRTQSQVEQTTANKAAAPSQDAQRANELPDGPRTPAASAVADGVKTTSAEDLHKTKEVTIESNVAVAEEKAQEISDEFRISLTRERLSQSDLGLETDSSDGKTLLILKVRDGPVKDWNARSNKDLKVRHCDRIIEVNGVAGDSARLQEIIKAERDLLLLTIKRAQEFPVQLEHHSGKIGLDIVHSAGESLLIKRIKEGLVSNWNKQNAEKQIRTGDRIVQINGKRGDSHKLLDLVASAEKLDLVICRTAQL